VITLDSGRRVPLCSPAAHRAERYRLDGADRGAGERAVSGVVAATAPAGAVAGRTRGGGGAGVGVPVGDALAAAHGGAGESAAPRCAERGP